MAERVQPQLGSSHEGAVRRSVFRGGMAALAALAFARHATASKTAPASIFKGRMNASEWSDRVAISDVIMRERWARETRNPDIAAACFHPASTVEVSWFKGTGAEFVDTARGTAPSDTVNFDSMSPPVIWVKKGRALADTSCAVHTFLRLDGIEVSTVSYTRLLWRVQQHKGQWLIAGLRGAYIRDTLSPSSPNQDLRLDEKKLSTFRPSYRHLSYVLLASGRPMLDDLPGVDRPETMEALRAAEHRWLEQA